MPVGYSFGPRDVSLLPNTYLWSRGSRATPQDFTPERVSELFAWYDANDITDADGTAVATWTDKGGNGKDLTQSTAGSRPTIQTGSQGRVVRFAGSHWLSAATASDWKFLHDGTGGTVFVVGCKTGVNPEAREAFIATSSAQGGSRGFSFSLDDRSSVSRDNVHMTTVSNGSSFVRENASGDNEARGSGFWHVVACRFWNDPSSLNDLQTWISGGLGKATAGSISTQQPSSSDPAGAFTVGATPTGTLPLTGDVAAVLVYSRKLSVGEINVVIQYLANLTHVPSVELEDEEVLLNDGAYNSFPSLVRTSTGRLIASYRAATSHVGTAGTIDQMVSDDDGVTWSSPATVISDASFDLRGPSISTIAGGNLLMTTWVRTSVGAAVAESIRVYRSTNNGDTWTLFSSPATGFTGLSATQSAPQTLSDGSLIFAVYGYESGADTVRSVKILRSTDSGANWSVLATAADGAADTQEYNEPTVFLRTDGSLVCIIRNGSTNGLHTTTSTDNGATWSTVGTELIEVESKVTVSKTDEVWLAPIRRVLSTPTCLYSSQDEGATWQRGDDLNSSGSGQYAEIVLYGTDDLLLLNSYEVNGGNDAVIAIRKGKLYR